MADSIFISYAHKDEEFVQRLAADLQRAAVEGVWFDRSDLIPGDDWQARIRHGIETCKAFILVVSPDSGKSAYVQKEIEMARQARKLIIPVVYKSGNIPPLFQDLLKNIQYLDLRQGSYADSLLALERALAAQGIKMRTGDVSFLPERARTSWGAVFGRIPSWAFAWSIGWALFWAILGVILVVTSDGDQDPAAILMFAVGGGVGGFAGGLWAGFLTMLVLRRHAPSVQWKHISPAIRIWLFSGVIGAVASVLITQGIVAGMSFGQETDCSGLGFGDCLGQGIANAIGGAIEAVITFIFFMVVIVLGIWFATGMYAGWQAVRAIRRLEPGIVPAQTLWVVLGWGGGALVGAISAVVAAALLTESMGL